MNLLLCSSQLTDALYEEVSEETLDSLTEKFEDLGEENFTSDNYDVGYAVCIKLSCSKYAYCKGTKIGWFFNSVICFP